MRAFGSADRYVIARENNVVVVDFRRPDPPAPHFPGAGALRSNETAESDFSGSLGPDYRPQQRFL